MLRGVCEVWKREMKDSYLAYLDISKVLVGVCVKRGTVTKDEAIWSRGEYAKDYSLWWRQGWC